jgi:RNA polymerase sigma-70 factor (ECF subfamily)
MSRTRAGDDADLAQRLAAREGGALTALYDRFGAAVYSLALRVVQIPGDAEEVTQEVFLYAWEKTALYDAARGSLLAWLCAIARSRAIDRKRAQRSHERRKEAAMQDVVAFPPLAGGPDHDASLSEIGAAVRAALATLPAEQRQAIEIAYFEGLSQSEIAARLATPLGTIKSRMRQGMMRLREALAFGAQEWER